MAQLSEFIETKENKYNHMIGEKGLKISGGQLQRIVLCRALYMSPSIIFLDEATSALDPQTEENVLFRIKNSEIIAVSTDGHRLVRHINKGFKFKKSIKGDFIAPRKFLSFLLNQELEKNVKILLGENYIAAENNKDVVITRLIDERFPDYDSVIPKDNKKVLNVSKSEFLSAIRRVSIFSNKSTHQVAINLKEKEVCNISTEDPEKSSKAHESLNVKYKGDELIIGYNAEYLKDVVSHIPTENVIINFNTSISAALFSPSLKEEKSDTLMLLMPIRLND